MRPKKRTHLFILLFWGFSATLSFAQHCHSQLLHETKLQDADYLQFRSDFEAKLQQFMRLNEGRARSPITIPVVFHIVWNEEDENIADAQILSQLAVLNKDFRKLNAEQSSIAAEFQALAADMELDFVLAEYDPDGNPTSGITRKFTEVVNIGDRFLDNRRSICYNDLGGQDAWCPDSYLNIWVGALEAGIAQSSFPGMDPLDEDGIRIEPKFVGTIGTATPPYHLGRTLTHEIGHFFDLFHLWGGFGGCDVDDGIEDTPLQATTYLGDCPSSAAFSCGTSDMYMNYLNYTDDACMAMFSQGQKERVWAVLNTERTGFLNQEFCDLNVQVEELIEEDIQVYPNPVRNEVVLEWSKQSLDQIVLMNVNGTIIEQWTIKNSQEKLQWNCSKLSKGIYFFIFQSTSSIKTQKLIVI